MITDRPTAEVELEDWQSDTIAISDEAADSVELEDCPTVVIYAEEWV